MFHPFIAILEIEMTNQDNKGQPQQGGQGNQPGPQNQQPGKQGQTPGQQTQQPNEKRSGEGGQQGGGNR